MIFNLALFIKREETAKLFKSLKYECLLDDFKCQKKLKWKNGWGATLLSF